MERRLTAPGLDLIHRLPAPAGVTTVNQDACSRLAKPTGAAAADSVGRAGDECRLVVGVHEALLLPGCSDMGIGARHPRDPRRACLCWGGALDRPGFPADEALLPPFLRARSSVG